MAGQQPREAVSSGFAAIDGLLPAGGVRRGSLIELRADGGAAGGAVSLACAMACQLARPLAGRSADESVVSASTIVVVDRGARLHPPAVMPWLDDLGGIGGGNAGRPQFVVARPSRDEDEIWTIDQALRCSGVAAVLAWPGRVHATAMRRFQLAARTSGAVGLLIHGLAGSSSRSAGKSRQNLSPQQVDLSPQDSTTAARAGGLAPAPSSAPSSACSASSTWSDARLAVAPLPAEAGADSAVRRLRLSLVGGPWSGDAMLEERSAELFLDLASGREAVRRRRPPGRPGVRPDAAPAFRLEEVACRAS